ncbi:MAG TPA: hypothetical protein VM452_04780 [Caulifigura sp.]|nr:hypothetical protein [Caulifigura sp.]
MTRFFNLFDRFRIAEASAEAMNARSHSEQTRHEVDQLRQQVDTLTITCQALCETLRDQLGVSEEEFVAKLGRVDNHKTSMMRAASQTKPTKFLAVFSYRVARLPGQEILDLVPLRVGESVASGHRGLP